MQAEHDNIAVLFSDRAITYLFSELLEAQGYETQIITDIKALSQHKKLVTEYQYYQQLPKDHDVKCLIVSNQPKDEVDAVYLSRPLTEEKVEKALRTFLQ